MYRLLLSSIVALGLIAPAAAQINTVPQTGLITSILKNPTYSAISVGLVPAASATDLFCLNGSTTKTVHLDRLRVSGTAGTAITTPVILKLNHSLDTGGTAATGLALPVAAPNNPGDPAATATLTAYTGNPTVNDSTPNYLHTAAVSFAVTTSTNPGSGVELKAGTAIDFFNKGWDIPKASTVVQQLCVNLNGVSISSGVLAITAEWTEAP